MVSSGREWVMRRILRVLRRAGGPLEAREIADRVGFTVQRVQQTIMWRAKGRVEVADTCRRRVRRGDGRLRYYDVNLYRAV